MQSLMIWLGHLQDILDFKHCSSKAFREGDLAKAGVGGFLLGLVGGIHIFSTLVCGIYIATTSSSVPWIFAIFQWSFYVSLLCIFHFMEFLMTAMYQPGNLAYESFVISHSREYSLAVIACMIEYWLESLIFCRGTSCWKHNPYIFSCGLCLLVVGQIVRSVAMATCGENFAHMIMHEKEVGHQLIKNGIYKFLRHPSYFGWFYWSVATQEEKLLLKFYGMEYYEYMRQTQIGIPFISTDYNAALNIVNKYFRSYPNLKHNPAHNNAGDNDDNDDSTGLRNKYYYQPGEQEEDSDEDR